VVTEGYVKDNVHMADFFLSCSSQGFKELFWQCYRKWYFVSTLSNWGRGLQKFRWGRGVR